MVDIGGKIGLLVRGTILKYNGDGTVEVGLDRNSGTASPQKLNTPMPLAFAGPNGEFLGGFPTVGASVILYQSQGEWFISSYINSNNVFTNLNTIGINGKNTMAELKTGRILAQPKSGSARLLLDVKDGVFIGLANQQMQADTDRGILSHNYKKEMAFSSAHRSIKGIIKRDLKENATRGITGSSLTSHDYEDTLFSIGMDPSTKISTSTNSTLLRNLPLNEEHEIVYEFQNLPTGTGYTNDEDEAERYISKLNPAQTGEVLRTDSRTDIFNLTLSNPNFLMESVKGTGVDIYGNVLDLNRNILPIGKTNETSFVKNTDGKDAFKKIRALHRKGLAYHFELNSRKQTGSDEVSQVPNVNSKTDFARDRSRFFIDVDKEGQFKINISASSETGNIPLLTRYETASTILAAQGEITNPNAFVRESDNKDIFHENFALHTPIKLTRGNANLDGYESPVDRFTDKPIGYGTAFHDITKTISEHQDTGRDKLINYFEESETYLNRISYVDKVVSDNIIVAGENANAGGRSGTISTDGSMVFNIGANTIDRQSLWIDTAGGIVSNIGRDRFGHSYCGSFDGDVLVQVGGKGIGTASDSRFKNENDAARSGTFDIRILRADGQLTVIRVDDKGLFISSPGRIEFNCEQEMILRSNSNIKLEGKSVLFYPDNGMSRSVKRNGVPVI